MLDTARVAKQLNELGKAVAALQKNGVSERSVEEKGIGREEKEKGELEEGKLTALKLEIARLSNRVWKVVAEIARSHGENKHTWERALSAWSSHTPERTSLELNNLTTLSNAALRHVPKMAHLQELSLIASSGFDAAGLMHVSKLTGLAKLDVRQSPMLGGRTANVLEGISAMTGLEDLCLSQTKDKGLRYLTGLTNLKVLSAPTEISDAGMEHVKQLTGLKRLELKDCRLGERGIACLEGLPGLERIKTNVDTLLTLDIGVLPGVVIANDQRVLFER
ncbi:unnamed protein product [Closterium sp. Yama58-4]|nr:unnamed protein product [Closterium sp. Yama58-4]